MIDFQSASSFISTSFAINTLFSLYQTLTEKIISILYFWVDLTARFGTLKFDEQCVNDVSAYFDRCKRVQNRIAFWFKFFSFIMAVWCVVILYKQVIPDWIFGKWLLIFISPFPLYLASGIGVVILQCLGWINLMWKIYRRSKPLPFTLPTTLPPENGV